MNSTTALHAAARAGEIAALRLALSQGIPVDVRDESDFTPLALAAQAPLVGAEVLQLLIEAGADVNAAVEQGRHAPLELAACSGSFEKVCLLLQHGADVRHTDSNQYTVATHVAYHLQQSPSLVPMLQLLADHGADLQSASKYGESPLSVSFLRGYPRSPFAA